MANEELSKKLADVSAAGAKKFGDAWTHSVNAIVREVGPAGLPDEQVANLANAGPDALHHIGTDVLLSQLSRAQDSRSGNRDLASELDGQYRELRRAQREAWRKAHGRE